jgi:FMN-dependent NADH-azoreductase
MKTLLYIAASPRGELSASSRAATQLLDLVKGRAPQARIDHLNIWAADLPPFDGEALAAKYARLGGKPLSEPQQRAWEEIGRHVARLDAADAVLISTPMWNLGIPYRLKHLFDLVTQPGLSFSFDPSIGYTPILKPRPTAVLMASSGDFTQGPSYGRPDLASTYLRTELAFIGLRDPEIVHIAPTAGPPDAVEAGRERARPQIGKVSEWLAGALR